MMNKLSFRKYVAGFGLAALLAGTTSGLAADLPRMDPPPPPPPVPELRQAVHDWSGIYVGAAVNILAFDTRYLPIGADDPELAATGVMGTGILGFNAQFGNYVVGIEGDISYGDFKAHNRLDEVDFDIPWVATARVRAGYAMDDTLLYLTGGLGVLKGDMLLTALGQTDEKTHYGWVIGGGMEHVLSGNLNLRLEYLYGHFGKEDYEFPAGTVRMGIDNLHQVRVGLVYNFTAQNN